MATIDNKETILLLLENDGYYPGDPQLAYIYSYIHTGTGDKLYGIYLSTGDRGPYGPYCSDIILLQERENGLTEDGEKELLELQKGDTEFSMNETQKELHKYFTGGKEKE